MKRVGARTPRRPNRRRVPGALALPALLLTAPLLAGWSFFDPFHENVEKGNEKAREKDTEAALRHYDEAARVDPGSPIPDFNRGIVLSQDGRGEEAGDAFLAAAASEDPAVAADALYNLGNVLLEGQQYAPAVEAYLKSLDVDPDDEDARRNLEIAFRRMEEQQQQQQQQDQQQDPQEPSDDQQPNPQPEDEEEPNEEETSQQPQEQEEPQPQPEPEEAPQERLTREDAERLLNAIESDELKVLQQLQDQQEESTVGVGRDW